MCFVVFDDVACSSFLNIRNSQSDDIKFIIEKFDSNLKFFVVDIKVTVLTILVLNGFKERQLIRVYFLILLCFLSNINLV